MLLSKRLRLSAFRLALLYAGPFTAAILAAFGYAYWAAGGYLWARFEQAIERERDIIFQTYERGGTSAVARLIDSRATELGYTDSIYLLTDASFSYVAGNLSTWPRDFDETGIPVSFTAPKWQGRDGRPPALRAVSRTLPDGSHVLVGKDATDVETAVGTIKTALASSVAIVLMLAAIAGIMVGRRSNYRIKMINATSRQIMQGGLSTRIPILGSRDETDPVAENVNTMLDRIEELVRGMKQASDNIAHDLRTPLARLRGRLEAAQCTLLSPQDYSVLIEAAIADIDAVLAIFSSLLRISQIESSERQAAFRAVDLGELAGEVIELSDAAAEQSRRRIRYAGGADICVSGDRDLLFEALLNLVDNAIKHGAGDVTVETGVDGGHVVLSVSDRGPGVPDEERGRVLERFYRLERSRNQPGNGLGLSLVAAVARLHRAQIRMFDNSPGLTVALCFSSRQMRLPKLKDHIGAGRCWRNPGRDSGDYGVAPT